MLSCCLSILPKHYLTVLVSSTLGFSSNDRTPLGHLQKIHRDFDKLVMEKNTGDLFIKVPRENSEQMEMQTWRDSRVPTWVGHIQNWLSSVDMSDAGIASINNTDNNNPKSDPISRFSATTNEDETEPVRDATEDAEDVAPPPPMSFIFNPADHCCRVCESERLFEYVGPCEVYPGRIATFTTDLNGVMSCSCRCRPCLAYMLLPNAGRRCEKTGMYPRIKMIWSDGSDGSDFDDDSRYTWSQKANVKDKWSRMKYHLSVFIREYGCLGH